MTTIDLGSGRHTLSEVLALAKSGSVLLRTPSGEDFVLEPADDFDRETAALGASERFASLLQARSAETGDITLDEVRQRL
jgi:hypothetical protein